MSTVSAKPKFNVVIKVDNVKFIKYRGVTNFNGMISYLNANYPNWRYFNYFRGVRPYDQMGSYTPKNGWKTFP